MITALAPAEDTRRCERCGAEVWAPTWNAAGTDHLVLVTGQPAVEVVNVEATGQAEIRAWMPAATTWCSTLHPTPTEETP